MKKNIIKINEIRILNLKNNIIALLKHFTESDPQQKLFEMSDFEKLPQIAIGVFAFMQLVGFV